MAEVIKAVDEVTVVRRLTISEGPMLTDYAGTSVKVYRATIKLEAMELEPGEQPTDEPYVSVRLIGRRVRKDGVPFKDDKPAELYLSESEHPRWLADAIASAVDDWRGKLATITVVDRTAP